MRCKFCLTIGMSLAVLFTPSVKAALLHADCIVERAGHDLDGRLAGGENAIHFGAGCAVIHKLEIDLLPGIAGATDFAGGRDGFRSYDLSGATLYSGIANPVGRAMAIGTSDGGTWQCDVARCAAAGGRSELPFGARSESGIPDPAVLWLCMALFWLFAIVLRELLERHGPAPQGAPLRSVHARG